MFFIILSIVLLIYSIVMTILFIYKNFKYHRMGDIALKLDDQVKSYERKSAKIDLYSDLDNRLKTYAKRNKN